MITGAVYVDAPHRCVIPRVWKAANTLERMRGLLGRAQLSPGEGFLIESCNLVHTVGMRYALDLVFLDAEGRICKITEAVRPMRCAGAFAAKATLELLAGTLAPMGLRLGQQLQWQASAAQVAGDAVLQ